MRGVTGAASTGVIGGAALGPFDYQARLPQLSSAKVKINLL